RSATLHQSDWTGSIAPGAAMTTLAAPPLRAARESPAPPPAPTRPGTPAATDRLLSLDAYRGLIMLTLLAGGIFHSLKGDPTWHWLYVQNEHVAWEGCRYWDLIQ